MPKPLFDILLFCRYLNGLNLTKMDDSIFTFTQLHVLSMFNNAISGSIPLAICNLQNVQVISLFGNNLSGQVPDCLGKLPSLKTL